MNIRYQGLGGTTYYVKENRIAGGGEGGIHDIENYPHLVAKIFKTERRDPQREEKLRLMVQTKLTQDQLKQITWPLDVIYDNTGFVGYIMPKLQNLASLTEIYSAGTYDLRYRLMAAVNLCAAIDTVHEMGQVCGDLNPQNICINLDENDRINGFKVTLVDTDSYHFTADGATYRCEVGLGDYIAPELQNKMVNGLDLKNVPLPSYTRATDLFALAVHIFCLLMNGCHPFACAKEINPKESNIEQLKADNVKDSVVAPQPIENIKSGFFPFYEKRTGIVHPIYAPAFDSLPSQIRQLFVRTFVDGHIDPTQRVTAIEWQNALMPLLGNIAVCNGKTKHYYFNHNMDCPMCAVDKRIREMFENAAEDDEKDKNGSSNEKGDSTNKVFEPLFWTKFWLISVGIVVAIIIAVNYVDTNQPNVQQYEQQQDLTEEQNPYEELMAAAANYIESGDYDSAISSCDQAIALDSTKSKAYFYKGKALYAKNDLENALAVLKIGKDEISDTEMWDEIFDLYYEVEEKYEEQQEAIEKEKKKAAANAKKLKKLNKIISAIKNKNYKKAGTLTKNYCYNHDFNKIYIKNGKIVDTIKSGKGFVINDNNWYAYYGYFKNGKLSGKGIEVGKNGRGNYKVQGKYKNNKLNGKATIYQWNQKLNSNTYNLKIAGNYKNNKENGRMTITYYHKRGSVYRTCYCNSSNGKRSVIEYDSAIGYVYAQTSNGDYHIGNTSKSALSGNGNPRSYRT